MNKEDN